MASLIISTRPFHSISLSPTVVCRAYSASHMTRCSSIGMSINTKFVNEVHDVIQSQVPCTSTFCRAVTCISRSDRGRRQGLDLDKIRLVLKRLCHQDRKIRLVRTLADHMYSKIPTLDIY